MKTHFIICLVERKGSRRNTHKSPNELRLTQMGVLIDEAPVNEFKTKEAALEAISDNWSGEETEFVLLEVITPVEENKVREEICDYCDGCGWYGGGPTLKTTCLHCGGSGVKLK